ncbi:hypothetical protein ANN_25825 [Periplaneta americana]|uniref:DUF4817 domain-containing protein n=1 Tax=Periplaneta americana TaxID=6978 RepID=A0ABQ8S488_PERAM|nr:hypothetical protein ANN_25825 [Periplaneta americana]
MEEYTRAEYANMIFEYARANGNSKQAHRLYRSKYPHRRHQAHTIFPRLFQRSLDGTRCRHGCPEIETLAHVLGFCEQGLLLRNSRHHLVRSKVAATLRNKGWIVEEEISCLAENGSMKRVDILAYNADTKQGIIVDPTIRFEVECHQSAEVHLEKKSIYEPTVNYFKLKYALIHVEAYSESEYDGLLLKKIFHNFRRVYINVNIEIVLEMIKTNDIRFIYVTCATRALQGSDL